MYPLACGAPQLQVPLVARPRNQFSACRDGSSRVAPHARRRTTSSHLCRPPASRPDSPSAESTTATPISPMVISQPAIPANAPSNVNVRTPPRRACLPVACPDLWRSTPTTTPERVVRSVVTVSLSVESTSSDHCRRCVRFRKPHIIRVTDASSCFRPKCHLQIS